MLKILAPGALFPTEFPKGAILLVDKPLGWTSFDVVNKIRYLLSRKLGVKRIKIGHAGTLDPLASGLLILCTGDYTKKIESLQALEKEYTGTITFGATTPSYDLEKPVDATYPTAQLNDALLQNLCVQFTGDIEQLPPMFSAVKVDGKRLYKNARTGQEVALALRPVRVDLFELGPLHNIEPETIAPEPIILNKKGAPIYQHPEYAGGVKCTFRVVCGKGTYIRSLAHDLGQAAGSGAYLSSLRRTRTGGFSVADAWSVEALAAWIGAV
ncbi:MAG: tRNA pseudouridine(55) synthase TruB [Saprospiraceae bacterium]